MPAQQDATLSRLLLVEGQPEFRKQLLKSLTGLPYDIAVAHDGAEAVAMVRRLAFDVVLTALNAPKLAGLDILSLVKELSPRTEVILFAERGTMEDAIRALRGGAFDFVLKPDLETRALLMTIERALNRRFQTRDPPARVAPSPEGPPLSAREIEVVRLASEGLENKAIAQRLNLSTRTVGNHLSSVYEKLGVSNRTQATMACRRMGLI